MNFIFSIKKGNTYKQNSQQQKQTNKNQPFQRNHPQPLNNKSISLNNNPFLNYGMIRYIETGNKSCGGCGGAK